MSYTKKLMEPKPGRFPWSVFQSVVGEVGYPAFSISKPWRLEAKLHQKKKAWLGQELKHEVSI